MNAYSRRTLRSSFIGGAINENTGDHENGVAWSLGGAGVGGIVDGHEHAEMPSLERSRAVQAALPLFIAVAMNGYGGGDRPGDGS